jgi:hypothetical protein
MGLDSEQEEIDYDDETFADMDLDELEEEELKAYYRYLGD